MAVQKMRRGSLFFLVIVFVVVALVLATQQGLALALARWVVGVWMATMDVVLRLFGVVFPG